MFVCVCLCVRECVSVCEREGVYASFSIPMFVLQMVFNLSKHF